MRYNLNLQKNKKYYKLTKVSSAYYELHEEYFILVLDYEYKQATDNIEEQNEDLWVWQEGKHYFHSTNMRENIGCVDMIREEDSWCIVVNSGNDDIRISFAKKVECEALRQLMTSYMLGTSIDELAKTVLYA